MADGLSPVELSEGFEYDEFVEEINAHFASEPEVNKTSNLDSHVKFRTGIGKFVIPRENSWAAHRQLIRDPKHNLGFAPLRYPFFDYVIAENVDYAPLNDPHHKAFGKLVGMRENLAILRNYLFQEFFPDGSFDQNDVKKVPKILAISSFLAEAIDNDRYIPSFGKPRIDKSKANQYGTGAQYMYKKILERQTTHSWIRPWMRKPFEIMFGISGRNWGLPRLEDSPFSDANLQKPPPPPVYSYTEDELFAVAAALANKDPRSPRDAAKYHADTINRIADNFVNTHHTYSSVEMMRQPVKRQSVEIAKDILRKLKVKIGRGFIAHGLTPDATANLNLLDAIEGVIDVYEFHLAKATARDPRLLHHPVIAKANDAVGKLGYVAKVEALRMAEHGQDDQLGKALYNQIMHMPKDWHHPKEKRFGELFDQIEAGLDLTLNKLTERDHRNPHGDDWRDKRKTAQVKFSRNAVHQDTQERELRNQRIDIGNDLSMQISAQNTARRESAEAMQQGRPAAASSGQLKAVSGKLSKDQLAKMRGSMQTPKDAKPVEVGAKASIRQAIRERDMAVKRAEEQRRQNSKKQKQLKTVETINRANQRMDDPPNPAARKPGAVIR